MITLAAQTRANVCECKWTSWFLPGDFSRWAFTASARDRSMANPLIANSSSKARLTRAEKKFSLLRFEF
jgi:hypothetical protein